MMVRKAFTGVGLVVCLLAMTASLALAERIEVQVYETNDANAVPPPKTRLLEGVEVTLWWIDSPQGEVPVAAAITDPQGNAVFEDVGVPGQLRTYEVRLDTLPGYVPQPAPGQNPRQAAAGLPFVVANAYQTAQPSPAPMPEVTEMVPQNPPRNGMMPSSGGIPTMGIGGTQRAEFPAARSEPEDGTETFTGFMTGLVFRDVGEPDGIYVKDVDETVGGANVEIDFRDPNQGITAVTTPPSGVFFDATKVLLPKADGSPPDVFIRARENPQAPWGDWRKIPITLDPITGGLSYLITSTRFSVGSQAPTGSVAGRVVRDQAPGNGVIDPGEPGEAGETVELRRAATDELVDSTTSGANGAFEFTVVADGTYKVLVPGVVTRVVAVVSGGAATGADLLLPFEAPLGSIAGRVVQDQAPGNGQVDPGEPGVSGQTVQLRLAATDALLDSTTSGGDGGFSFADVADGSYKVMVQGVVMREVSVANGQALTGADLLLPYEGPEPPPTTNCTEDNCTQGPLHEVVLEGAMWVGALPSGFDVSATLRENCCATSDPVDTVQLAYQGTAFPGRAVGLDEVLAIEDVRMEPGAAWANVRLRLTAATGAFADGSFGDVSRRLELTLNGRSTVVCWRFRCETTCKGGRVGVLRVLGTLSRDAWAECTDFEIPPSGGDPEPPAACQPKPPVCQPPPPPPVVCKPEPKVCKPKPKVCKPKVKVSKTKKKAWSKWSWKPKKTKKVKRSRKAKRSWSRWRRR